MNVEEALHVSRHLSLVAGSCAICGSDAGEPVAVGEDFEYRTSADVYLMRRCPNDGSLYLDPRPADEALASAYPDGYHAFGFTDEDFGVTAKARRALERRRLAPLVRNLPPDARIVDVGCGDGFHLDLLRGLAPTAQLEGIEPDPRAAKGALRRGLNLHESTLEDADLLPSVYDLALLVMVIEHVPDPAATLTAIRRILRPGGQLYVVTDNAAAPDARLFAARHWGGYHFPRHLHLFDAHTLTALARRTGFAVQRCRTATSPVNWTYSVRNLLDDLGAPRAVVRRFALDAPVALGAFTLIDAALTAAGRGGILRAVLRA